MNALPETLTASMTKVFGLFPLSATARSRSGTLVGQAWSWPVLITLWCDSTEAGEDHEFLISFATTAPL